MANSTRSDHLVDGSPLPFRFQMELTMVVGLSQTDRLVHSSAQFQPVSPFHKALRLSFGMFLDGLERSLSLEGFFPRRSERFYWTLLAKMQQQRQHRETNKHAKTYTQAKDPTDETRKQAAGDFEAESSAKRRCEKQQSTRNKCMQYWSLHDGNIWLLVEEPE